jgi:hypothetical protein
MNRHEKNIDKILQGLEKEVDDRRNSDLILDKKVDGFQSEIKEYMKSAYRTAGIVGVSGALVLSAFFYWLQIDQNKKIDTRPGTNQTPISIDSIKKILKDLPKDTIRIK